MNIGVLGGTFDPPHVGHVIVADQIRAHLGFDRIWLLPVSIHAFSKRLSDAQYRLEMTRLLETKYTSVCDLEIKNGGVSSTFETMEKLSKMYPDDSFSFCLGTDLLGGFKRWKNWRKIIEEYSLVIYQRGFIDDKNRTYLEDLLSSASTHNITVLSGQDIVTTNISSTLVRKLYRQGKSVESILSKDVLNYIKNHNLYK